MYTLINNYQSDETMPYVVSSEVLPSYDDAMETAKIYAEEALMNHYIENYSDDEIEMEVANHSIYIKGPDFIDWWTVIKIELPTNSDATTNTNQ